MKSLRDLDPAFHDRRPDFPPLPPVLPGEDPPTPRWVLSVLVALAILGAALAGAIIIALAMP